MNLYLRVRTGESGSLSHVPLAEGRFVIGRGDDVHIQIQSSLVSRHHAELIVEEDSVRINDLGSANGTLVNDQSIREMPLKAGDKIQIGNTNLELVAGDPNLTQKTTRSTIIQKQKDPTDIHHPIQRIYSIQWILMSLLGLLLCTLIIASSSAFLSIAESFVQSLDDRHATSMVKYLAEKNREDLKSGKHLLLSVKDVEDTQGVKEVQILDSHGNVVMPYHLTGIKHDDPWTMRTLDPGTALEVIKTPLLPSGETVYHYPIRAFDEAKGKFTTVGAIRMSYRSMSYDFLRASFQKILWLWILLSLVVSFILGLFVSKWIRRKSNITAEQIHLWRAGKPAQTNHKWPDELSDLAKALARLFGDSR